MSNYDDDENEDFLKLEGIEEPVVLNMDSHGKNFSVLSPKKLLLTELRKLAEEAELFESGGRGIIVTESAPAASVAMIMVEYTYRGHIFWPRSLSCFHVFDCRIITRVNQALLASLD